MKKQKTIATLFREQQYKLNQRPSPRTWRRLEKRLDLHYKRGRNNLYRYVLVAAAVVAIVAALSLLSTLFDNKPTDYLVLNDRKPKLIEDLVYSDTDAKVYQVVEFTRQYRDRLANPVKEGAPGKDLTLSATARMTPPIPNERFNVKPNATLQDFNWLLGKWKSKVNGLISVEYWSTTGSAQQFIGKGALLSEKDTLFSEEMTLQQQNGKMIFRTVFEKGQAPISYTLISFTDRKMVFENRRVVFPQQVVIELQSKKAYTLTFQNDRPIDLTSSQVAFLRQRNTIVNQQIVRFLEKE